MPRYIKSHSNYVLRSKHQLTNDGTIWERDITTIGGVDQFSPGQMPVYRSGNFIISIRSDEKVSNQYNMSKWVGNDNGTVWTLSDAESMVSDDERQDDTKIILKQDYYDFCDFAYYGSLTELFRASVGDILDRFPGELYTTTDSVYYESGQTRDFRREVYNNRLGGEDMTVVSNPFGINIHSLYKPENENGLKYFADGGYENYVMFSGDTFNEDDEDNYVISSWQSELVSGCTSKGEKFGTIRLENRNGDSLVVEGWYGDNKDVYYLVDKTKGDIHIRPIQKHTNKFYNDCDNFEYLLVNPKSTPKYSSIFSVIKENDYGYYRELTQFTFPTAVGGYNLDTAAYGFSKYTKNMVEIGDYYDERFTDNLYRSMTHESIKNFDWSHSRYEDTDEDYILGGQKMQKALRIFAREFDEILAYINNIKNLYTVTYNERSNIPDYFLTDVVENEGWDVKLVLPYNLEEYYYKINEETNEPEKIKVDSSGYTVGGLNCDGQLNNIVVVGDDKYNITRVFSQPSSAVVTPYTLPEDDANGYFLTCYPESGTPMCKYGYTKYYKMPATAATMYEASSGHPSGGVVRNRIRPFSDSREYTYMDANNEFLRRLKINSRYIWRHKGTIEGLEMVLAMFGLKSKRWAEAQKKENPCVYSQSGNTCMFSQDENGLLDTEYDFDISEYTLFTNRIEEEWDAIHQKYANEWLNSTKTNIYRDSLVKKFTQNGVEYVEMPYMGLPVVFRDEYEYTNTACTSNSKYAPYIKISPLEDQITSGVTGTSNPDEAFRRIDESNAPVLRRYLYPNFEKYDELDGNPIFQLNGGWLSKSIDDNGMKYNFQFDVDDNVVYTDFFESGAVTSDGEIFDNGRLYKETIRNIRMEDNVASLLNIPYQSLYDGMICYVRKIEKDSAIVESSVYEINHEYIKDYNSGEGTVASYISLIKTEGMIKIGSSLFFDKTIIVLNSDGVETEYTIDDKPDGYEVKAYVIFEERDGREYTKFVCKEDASGYYSVSNFIILANDNNGENTNYFVLNKEEFGSEFATYDEANNTWTDGWRRLKLTDSEYLKINTIYNYYQGNNGHNGNMRYDSGHEYLTYFKRLFKDALDNNKFDERCFDDYYGETERAQDIGFGNLIEENEKILEYNRFLNEDKKIHYFGNYKKRKEDNSIDKVFIYGENCERIENYKIIYSGETDNVSGYILNSDSMLTVNPYSAQTGDNVDEVTNQIMNTKRVKLTFNLHGDWYTQEGQTEVKYLDDIVMNYLTQMIPSTAIFEIVYKSRCRNDINICDEFNRHGQAPRQPVPDEPTITWDSNYISVPYVGPATITITGTDSEGNNITRTVTIDYTENNTNEPRQDAVTVDGSPVNIMVEPAPQGDTPTEIRYEWDSKEVTTPYNGCSNGTATITLSGRKITKYEPSERVTTVDVTTSVTMSYPKNDGDNPIPVTSGFSGATVRITVAPCNGGDTTCNRKRDVYQWAATSITVSDGCSNGSVDVPISGNVKTEYYNCPTSPAQEVRSSVNVSYNKNQGDSDVTRTVSKTVSIGGTVSVTITVRSCGTPQVECDCDDIQLSETPPPRDCNCEDIHLTDE